VSIVKLFELAACGNSASGEFFVARNGPRLEEGEILIRNHRLSADPAMRGWISDTGGYRPQVAIGETMRAFAVGEVIESRPPSWG
jgi:NADPH-dependent curcumin reductase CurA